MVLDVAAAEAAWDLDCDGGDVVVRLDSASALIEAYLHAGQIDDAFMFARGLVDDPPLKTSNLDAQAAHAVCNSWIATAQLAMALAQGGPRGLRRAYQAALRAETSIGRLRRIHDEINIEERLHVGEAIACLARISVLESPEKISAAYEDFWRWEADEHPVLSYLTAEALRRSGQYEQARAAARDNREFWTSIWPDPDHPHRQRIDYLADGRDFGSGPTAYRRRQAETAVEVAFEEWQFGLDAWLSSRSDASNAAKHAILLAALRDKLTILEEYLQPAANDEFDPLNPDQDQAAARSASVREQLAALVGLEGVKEHIARLEANLRTQKLRSENGLQPVDIGGHHLVFTGNPGTGKTTVARLIGQLYRDLGFLSEGHVVEASRANLVGKYIGQSESKTTEILESALGGVLFIDEAYALNPGDSSRDFGARVIDEVVKFASDHEGELVIILAGYPDEMQQLLDVNPGLRSRFSRVFSFDDLAIEQLVEVYRDAATANDYVVSDEAVDALRTLLDRLPRDRNFGNARTVLDLFKRSVERHGSRVDNVKDPSIDDLQILAAVDVPSLNDLVVDPPDVVAKDVPTAERQTGLYL